MRRLESGDWAYLCFLIIVLLVAVYIGLAGASEVILLGTGTTVLAAMQSGRRGIGIELNPKYVELANQRISAITPNMFLEAAS